MAGSPQLYASVKAYGKKGKLLSRADLQALAESRDTEELVTRIKNTSYAHALGDLAKPYTAEQIERALGTHHAEMLHAMQKISKDSGVLGAYYSQLVAWNLKLVLKGKALGRSQEEIERRINMRVAELARERDVLVNAMVSGSFEEAVASLKTSRFGSDVAKAAELYAESKNVQVIDTYIDRATYEMLARAARTVRDAKISALDIDFYNMLAILRGKNWGLDEAALLDLVALSTPSITRSTLERIAAAATVRDAFSEISSTRYSSLVPQADNDLDAVSEFERALEMHIYDSCNKAFTKMFSFSSVIAITKLVAYEVRNIASISYAVEQGIPTETTMSKLIVSAQT